MESITRNVAELPAETRLVLEAIVGHVLLENQQVVLQVVELAPVSAPARPSGASVGNALPDWCNVYAGLSDEEIDRIERDIVRTPGTRSFT